MRPLRHHYDASEELTIPTPPDELNRMLRRIIARWVKIGRMTPAEGRREVARLGLRQARKEKAA